MRQIDAHGEVFLVGGALLCLADGARASTRDIAGFFRPPATARSAC